MQNVSRRDFLKCAGVTALAVAAAGMLAGCSGKEELVEVKVEYYYQSSLTGEEKPIQDAEKYAETVKVVKGQKVKKSDLKNLQAACSGSTTYNADKVPDEIEVDWTTGTAKVLLSF